MPATERHRVIGGNRTAVLSELRRVKGKWVPRERLNDIAGSGGDKNKLRGILRHLQADIAARGWVIETGPEGIRLLVTEAIHTASPAGGVEVVEATGNATSRFYGSLKPRAGR